MDLDVVWEDEHLLVVGKPAGVVVHPGTGHEQGTLVHGAARAAAPRARRDKPGIVHRLDATSGLLVVARSDEAHARLQELIRRRAVERRYLALVKGSPRSRTGRIEAPIGRDRLDKTPLARHGDPARGCDSLRGRRAARPARAARLEPGDTHADPRPPRGDPELPISGDRLRVRRRPRPRAPVPPHAAGLAFDHPFTGERVAVESPLPDDLAAALERARADAALPQS